MTLLYFSVHIKMLVDSGALRARALHEPVLLGPLTRKTGRYTPPPPPMEASLLYSLSVYYEGTQSFLHPLVK